jgi:hypothetical protein
MNRNKAIIGLIITIIFLGIFLSWGLSLIVHFDSTIRSILLILTMIGGVYFAVINITTIVNSEKKSK